MADAPEDGSRVNRRSDGPRAPITLRVDYKRLNTFFADYTRNISKGGTFIRTNKPLAVGEEFVFLLTLPETSGAGEPVQIELTGEVKWVVAEPEATADKPAGMGIQFVFKDDAKRAQMNEAVSKLMRDELGEHLASKLMPR